LNVKPRKGSERSTDTLIYFQSRRTPVRKFALLGALALASAMAATPVFFLPGLLEDADAIGQSEAQLFHLVNLMRERGTALVLTAKTPPDAWGLRTADLLSRLRLAPTAAIGPPDDALMRAVLVKLLFDRQLVVDTGVVGYIALRIERSLDAARSFIDALDREALARQSRISRGIAGDVLFSLGHDGEQGPFPEERDCSDNGGDEDRLSMTLPLTVRRSGSSGLGGL
jgi:hypothetical protein